MGIVFLIMMLFCQFCTRSFGNPLPTIYSRDGDIIDCVRREDQPAFGHPLLKNHIIQEFPTGFIKIKSEAEQNWQVWHETEETCPAGTIPIRRDVDPSNVDEKQFHPKKHSVVANERTSGHKYAIGTLDNGTKIYGARATFNVWDPVVESTSGAFSLAQIWVASGEYESGDLNMIEAGWQVYPAKYFDNQPRLFTFWTRNGYKGTGCYNIRCSGFVQISRKIALEAAISPTSTYNGTQLDIAIQILKDKLSGNWWLTVGRKAEPVGYWPAAIFTGLVDHATRVDWGGEVYFRNATNTKAQMGSGEYADKGFRRAAYVCNLKIAGDDRDLLPVEDFDVVASHPHYYTVKKWRNTQCGSHLYYGGPGPQLSTAVHQALASGFLFFFSIVSCLVSFMLI